MGSVDRIENFKIFEHFASRFATHSLLLVAGAPRRRAEFFMGSKLFARPDGHLIRERSYSLMGKSGGPLDERHQVFVAIVIVLKGVVRVACEFLYRPRER
jgi:hypothetical protein